MAGEISRGIGLLRVNAEGDTPSVLVHALFEAASRKEVARAERLLHRAFPVISISLPLLQLHCLTQLADHVLSHLCVGGDRALARERRNVGRDPRDLPHSPDGCPQLYGYPQTTKGYSQLGHCYYKRFQKLLSAIAI